VVRRVLQADDVPAFSRVMQDLMATLGRDEASAQRLANLVLRDYALTVKVIRAANSAHYNRTGRPVLSATHALMLLGAETVRAMAGAMLLFEHYRRRSPGLKELMLLSLLTASHARAAAEAAGGAEPETAHLCGMFRNLGEVLVAAHLPDEYAAVLRRVGDGAAAAVRPGVPRPDAAARRATCAAAVLGCSFEAVGVAIARHWGMPDVVRLGMTATGGPGEDRVGALTAFAHALTGAVYREGAGDAPRAADAVVDAHGARLGMSRAACRAVADQAVADTRELFAAAGMRLDQLRLARQVGVALSEARGGTPAAPADGAPAPGTGRSRPHRPRPDRPWTTRARRPRPYGSASCPSWPPPSRTWPATTCRACCSWRSRPCCAAARSTARASTRPTPPPASSARAPAWATARRRCSADRASRSPRRRARPAPPSSPGTRSAWRRALGSRAWRPGCCGTGRPRAWSCSRSR
jgi:HD-like signal output (HDOD) protein